MKIFIKNFRVWVYCLSCLCCSHLLSAQLVSGEYFFDTDPGVGKATKFTVPEEIYLDGQFEFPTDGLEAGAHQLGIRLKNDLRFGFTKLLDFYIEPATLDDENTRIVQGEFFIDTDPGQGKATPFTVLASKKMDDEFDLPLPELEPGSYQVGVRIRGDNGIWSFASQIEVNVVPEEGVEADFIKEFKYTIVDSDGKSVKSGTLTPNQQQNAIDEEFDLDLSGLPQGEYVANLLPLSDKGLPGVTRKLEFSIIDGNAPTAIALSNTSVNEKELIGTVVGQFSTTDKDENESHSYEFVVGLGGKDNASFEISGNQLLTKEVFDFSTKNSFSVRVKSTDLGELSFEESFEISIDKVKDAQTVSFEDITITTYGESQTLSASSSSGLVVTYESSNSEVAKVEGNELTFIGVGEVVITAVQAGNDDFLSADEKQNITVGKAALTATAEQKQRTYGEQNPDFTISYSGFKLNDSEADITAPSAGTTATEASVVGEYPINLTGGSATNYEIELVAGILTIDKATLTASADDKSREYGEENPEFTLSYSGFVENDSEESLTSSPTATTTATPSSDAGSYEIMLSGGADDNYEFDLTNATLTVTKAAITATADDKVRNKGEANPAFSISYDGFKNDDDDEDLGQLPTASTSATTTSNRGNYAIVLSGGSDTNYDFTLVNGTLLVTGPVYDLPSQLDFPTTNVESSADQTLTINNTGDGTLVISEIQAAGPFTADKSSLNVSAGSSAIVTIQFTPTEDNDYSETLRLISNDGTIEIQLVGSGQIVTALDDDVLDENEVKVYPNPAKQRITVDLNLSPARIYDVSLVSIDGIVMWSRERLSQKSLELLLDSYNPGAYLLKVDSDKGTVTKRIFILRE